MLDRVPTVEMQRSRGTAHAAFALRRGQVRLADLYQSGSAKLMLPRVAGPVPEAVFLNTSGGLTGGDRLAYRLDVGPQSRVLATTQTAERAYAAGDAPAEISFAATVGAGARLDWMPQETILYAQSRLTRRTEIDLATDAGCLISESVVLGRRAMGEVLRAAHLTDHRMIRRAGRPVWAETFQLGPEVLASRSPALLGDGTAMAVVCLVAQGAEDALGPVRDGLEFGAASAWDGKCIVRLLAQDGWLLKRQLARVLQILSGRPCPRVWQSGGY